MTGPKPNKVYPHHPDPNPPTIKKVPAESVPFGPSISGNGRTVWVALDGDRIVCIAATSKEVRRKFRDTQQAVGRAG